VYKAPTVKTPVAAVMLTLGAKARDGDLVLCVGAGISIPDDTALPSGTELGELLDAKLNGLLAGYVPPADTRNLIEVADAAVRPAGGLAAVQDVIVDLASFETATPNYGHQVLGMLLAEGAVTILSWNWDTCIERAAPPGEYFHVASTPEAMQLLNSPQLAKIHGCAAMRRTLLITSSQLSSDAPVWTQEALTTNLRDSRMVFVGIGDVADYAKQRIEDLLEASLSPDITLVGRSIRDKWGQTVWAKLLPDLLATERVIQRDSDEFLDELSRVWAIGLLQSVIADSSQSTEDVQAGIQGVVDALGNLTSVETIGWCRRAFFGLKCGDSAVMQPDMGNMLFALGVLVAQRGATARTPRPACCTLDGDEVEILIVSQRTWPTAIEREARRRAEALVSDNHRLGEEIVFLVGGTGVMGDLSTLPQEEWDIMRGAPADREDILDGQTAVRPRFLQESQLRMAA
jgi:hypothetical protein